MLLMRTIEDPAHLVGKLVSTKPTLGLDHFALAMTQLGSMALSHGLCMGRRKLTILTPPALFLTWRLYLWDLISPLDSRPFQPLGATFGQNSMYCTTEPTGRYRLECSSGSLACGPCTFGARARSGGGRR
jgi:hypothetical protein